MAKQAQSRSVAAPDGDPLTRGDFMSRLDKAQQRKPDETPPGDNDNDSDGDILETIAAAEDSIANDSKPGDGDQGKTGDGKLPKTLKALAETLGVSVEDVYKVEIALDNGGGESETMTLGALKDLAAKASDLEAREVKFSEKSAERENELLKARTELREIIAALPPGALTKEVLAKVRAKQKAYADAEAQRLLEAIPDWESDERQAQDRAGMQAHLSEYGIEAAFLDRTLDHRLVKFIRDAWRRYDAVTKALKNTKEITPRTHSPSARRGDTGSDERGGAVVEMPGRTLATHELRQAFSGLTK